jgi:hypothetical protein
VPTPRLEVIPGGAEAPPSIARALELAALALALVATCAMLGGMPSWRESLGRFQGGMLLAFAVHAMVLLRHLKPRALPHAGALIVVVAVAMRVAVLPAAPSLSDDLYRYLWEGRVLLAGHDPYALAPDAPALTHLRDAAVHARVNHPHLATIYPPVAMGHFAAVAALGGTTVLWKLWVLLHDGALCLVLVRWCQSRLGSPMAAIAYAWNPLVVTEYAGQGHYDPTAILMLVLALKWAPRHPVASAAALTLAVLGKLIPILALPFLWRDWTRRARITSAVSLVAGLAVFGWLTRHEVSGLSAYAATWRNNDALFGVLHATLGDPGARLAAGALVLAMVGAGLRRGWSATEGARWGMRAALMLGPVIHPWYLGWALALDPLRLSWPWWLLSCTVLLAYGIGQPPADAGAFHLGVSGRVVEFGLPLLLALTLATIRRGRESDGS